MNTKKLLERNLAHAVHQGELAASLEQRAREARFEQQHAAYAVCQDVLGECNGTDTDHILRTLIAHFQTEVPCPKCGQGVR